MEDSKSKGYLHLIEISNHSNESIQSEEFQDDWESEKKRQKSREIEENSFDFAFEEIEKVVRDARKRR